MNSIELKEKVSSTIMRIYEKNPFLLIGGVIFIVLLVDYLLVMQFQLRILGTLNPKITEMSQELKSTQNNIQRMPQYEKEMGRLSGSIEKTGRRVKTKAEVPLILKDISRIATQTGIQIEEVYQDTELDEPILENNDGKYYIVPSELQLRGGFHEFGRFLNQLDTEGAIVSIPEFKIASSGDSAKKHSIRIVVNTVVLEKN